jgi:hypothetical protein
MTALTRLFLLLHHETIHQSKKSFTDLAELLGSAIALHMFGFRSNVKLQKQAISSLTHRRVLFTSTGFFLASRSLWGFY